MKKVFISLLASMMAIVTVQAQQIAVVSGSTTTLCQTFKDAIETASNNSVIYLPAGGFPIGDDVKITKPLTIYGLTHKSNSDNADGRTTISGNLFFEEGSDGSIVMGCYISGNVYIGTEGASVEGIRLRYNNLNSVQVQNSECRGIEVNQCYVRDKSNFGNANAFITNSVIHSIRSVKGGKIENNIITSYFSISYSSVTMNCYIITADDTTIKNNVMMATSGSIASYANWSLFSGNNCEAVGNMLRQNWGEECVKVDVDWSEVFVRNAGINPYSDFHFKDNYKQYTNIGIYGGTGFSDDALPPVPYIVESKVDEQTDAAGKLKIRIHVKAHGE